MRLLQVGEDGLLVEVASSDEAMSVYIEVSRRGLRAGEIVPAARTVLFSGVPDLAELRSALAEMQLAELEPAGTLTVEVPTVYDGPDLEDVARLWDMTTREVVETHQATEFAVAFCGFAPGFAYCAGLPERLAVPRLESPRTKVRAGSVGLAGRFTGVYPSASPGGWRLVGRTELTLWDTERDQPATLAPGTVVRFVEVSG